jgi:hypothetical protein
MNASFLIHRLPRPLDHALRMWCYPAVLLARNIHIQLTQLRGTTRTGEAAVLVAGPDPWASDLARRLFKEAPQQSQVGMVPVWKVSSVLDKMGRDFDLVFARLDKLTARLFFPSNCLRVPEWVDTGRDLPNNPAVLLRSSESLTRDIRVARQNGLETSFSERPEDLEEFYRSMYVPFTRWRHGSMAWYANRQTLRHQLRRGGLIWLSCGGERVAGLVFEVTGRALGTRAYGTRAGYAGATKKGAASALYFHAIKHAISSGCEFLDLGGCHASLSDGLMLYKRKWGVGIRVRPGNQFYTLVRWPAWNRAVATFLADVPLLHQNGDRLIGVTATDLTSLATQADADRIYQKLQTPGMDRLIIVNAVGWSGNILPPPSAVLVSGAPLADQLTA